MGTVLLWGAAAVGALALAAVLWFRRGARAYRASIEAIVEGVIQLRAMAGASPRLVPLPVGSPEAASLDAAGEELTRADLRAVGDFHELGSDGQPAGAVRWFVSGDGGLVGWLGVTPAGPAMVMISEVAGNGFVVTLRSPHAPTTATPPTVVEDRLEWSEGLDAALVRHRAAVGRLGAPVPAGGMADALRSMDALKAHIARWRAAQDPDQLLEADARKILGDHFDGMGEAVVELVRVAESMAELARGAAGSA